MALAYPRIAAFFHAAEHARKLIVFDKDGTLIHFHAMWGDWIRAVAQQLSAVAGVDVTDRLFALVGFDLDSGVVDPRGVLAIGTMTELRDCAMEALAAAGVAPAAILAIIDQAWSIPDPVRLARPLTDLPALFAALRARGCQIAIATTDDRVPTQATLAAYGVDTMVSAMVCGDDRIPLKPEPDMLLTLCRDLGVEPAHTAMVGDTIADMRMGRSARVALLIGVLSGVGSSDVLAPLADVLLDSIADLLPVLA